MRTESRADSGATRGALMELTSQRGEDDLSFQAGEYMRGVVGLNVKTAVGRLSAALTSSVCRGPGEESGVSVTGRRESTGGQGAGGAFITT